MPKDTAMDERIPSIPYISREEYVIRYRHQNCNFLLPKLESQASVPSPVAFPMNMAPLPQNVFVPLQDTIPPDPLLNHIPPTLISISMVPSTQKQSTPSYV